MSNRHVADGMIYMTCAKLDYLSGIQGCSYKTRFYHNGRVALIKNINVEKMFKDLNSFFYYVEGKESMMRGMDLKDYGFPCHSVEWVDENNNLHEWQGTPLPPKLKDIFFTAIEKY